MRILVADDHASVRRYVCQVLRSEEDWQICAEASNGQEAVDRAIEMKPDAVVLDFSMPDLNGLDATRQILKKMPQTVVLILTMHEGEDLARAALESGAGAWLLKTDIQRLVAELRGLWQRRQCSPGG